MGATKGISKERLAKVVGIRDRSLAILDKNDKWEQASSIKALVARIGTLQLMHRSPFQNLPVTSERLHHLQGLLKSTPSLPYGLDIWHHNKKVFNLEWDDKGEFIVVSYKPGDWEVLLPTAPVAAL